MSPPGVRWLHLHFRRLIRGLAVGKRLKQLRQNYLICGNELCGMKLIPLKVQKCPDFTQRLTLLISSRLSA